MEQEDQVIKLTQLEAQVARLVEDLSSEKGTRARINSELNRRLDGIETAQRKLERVIYMAAGGLAVLQFFLAK